MSDVERFAASHDGAIDALSTVLECAAAGDGTVRWADVEDDLEPEQWGALLARGLLVDAGDAFVIDDPVAVRAVIEAAEDGDGPQLSADDPGTWSRADLVAGAGALGLLAGYQVAPIRSVVAGTIDLVLWPLSAALSFPTLVLVLAVATAIGSQLLRRWIETDDAGTERAAELREEIAAARQRGDEELVEALVQEQASLTVSTMKRQLRPLVWTMLLTVPALLWLYWLAVSPTGAMAPVASAAPVVGDVVWTARVVGPMQAWMLWYALCSLTANLVVKRVVRRVAPT